MKKSLLSFLYIILLLSLSNRVFAKSFTKSDAGISVNKFLNSLNLIEPRHVGFATPSYSLHYIAPAPWQYWNKATQIVVTTLSDIPVTGSISKSDGTVIVTFTASLNTPFVYRFAGLPKDTPKHLINTILNDAGIIVSATNQIAVNVRNVASDDLGSDGSDSQIKGNASLLSFGDAAIGLSFRVGYYRDGELAGWNYMPTYSIMAVEDDSIVKIGGVARATLNKGQSYLFKAPIGTLVESSGMAVMNTGAEMDAPGGCGDGAFNPIAPISSLGNEYVVIRGEGNMIAEQSTIVTTEANTSITIQHFDIDGVLKASETRNIVNAGGTTTFNHGYILDSYNSVTNTGRYSSSRIIATKNVAVYSGTAGASGGAGCEVDVAFLVPVSSCSDSRIVSTYKFTDYRDNALEFFGYILTSSPNPVLISTLGGSPNYTNVNLESISSPRVNLQGSNLNLIKFTKSDLGSPEVININGNSRVMVAMVQQSSAFSMSNVISRFPEKALLPSISQTDCSNLELSVSASSLPPYQWYFNGEPIVGATNSTYTATASGRYSLSSMLDCGISAPSLAVSVSLCDIDRSIVKTVDKSYVNLNENVNYTLTAKNLGIGTATGVFVKDLLPAGLTYVSSSAAVGTSYDSSTGIWSIGDVEGNTEISLTIQAKATQAGTISNLATIHGLQIDNNTANDQSTATIHVGSNNRITCVGNSIDPITIALNSGFNSSNVQVNNLPPGVTYAYLTSPRRVLISGVPTVVGVYNFNVSKNNEAPVVNGIITVNSNVSTPIFNNNLSNTRCQGADTNIYTATTTNATSLTYTLLPLSAGTINSVTGEVSWANTFTGVATIRATANGCQPKFAEFQVTVNNSFNVIVEDPEVCYGILDANIFYTTNITGPLTYSISSADDSITAVNDLTLPNNFIPISINSATNIGSYNGVLTISNTTGCTQVVNFILTIKPIPQSPSINLLNNSVF